MPIYNVIIEDKMEYTIEAPTIGEAEVEAGDRWSQRTPHITFKTLLVEEPKQSRRDRIKEVLENMDTDALVNLWNEYCDRANYTDDRIYPMESFNDFLYGQTPLAIIACVEDGSLCSHDDYFWLDGLGLYHSANYVGDIDVIDLDDLADYMDEYETSLDDSTIQDVFDEYATDEEESEDGEA